MDREKARKLQAAMQEALSLIETDFNVKFSFGKTIFSHNNAAFKIEGAEVGADGVVQSREAEAYKVYQKHYSLPDIGTTFLFRGTAYKIRGFNPKADKYAITADRVSDGRGFRFPIDVVVTKDKSPSPSAVPPPRAPRLSASGRWEAANS